MMEEMKMKALKAKDLKMKVCKKMKTVVDIAHWSEILTKSGGNVFEIGTFPPHLEESQIVNVKIIKS